MAQALNGHFDALLEKTVEGLVGHMTGKMGDQIKEMRKETQKQLDAAEAKVAGMQAALLMAHSIIGKALGAAPKNGAAPSVAKAPKTGRGGTRKGSGYPKVNEEQIQKMMKVYREHPEIPLNEVGRLFNVSGSYVYLLAQRRGLAYSRKALSSGGMNQGRRKMIAKQLAPHAVERTGPTTITPQIEKRIWELHMANMPNRQIAKELGIGHTTVERRIKAHRAPQMVAKRRKAGRLGGLKKAANRRAQEARMETRAETPPPMTPEVTTTPEPSPGVAPTG